MAGWALIAMALYVIAVGKGNHAVATSLLNRPVTRVRKCRQGRN